MNHKIEISANGLQLTCFPSRSLLLAEIDRQKLKYYLQEQFDTAYIILWLDNEVRIGLWSENDFHFYQNKDFDFKYVQRLRIFNNDREIHIWRNGETWKGRIRMDSEGEETDVVISHQLLCGTKGNRLDSQYIKLEEDRGSKLILPLAHFRFDDQGNPQHRIFIKTHNYVKANKIGQATYFDCRFVTFTDGEQELT